MSTSGGIERSVEATADAAVAPVPGARGIGRTIGQIRFLVAVALIGVALALWLKAGFAMPPGSISEGPLCAGAGDGRRRDLTR